MTQPYTIERTFNASPEKVWNAITDKNEMKQWYFDLAEFQPTAGFTFQFEGGTEQNKYLHLCTITEVVPNKKLSHTWRYDGYEGNTLVTFELFPEDDGTRLKLIHAGLETFPSDNPDFAAKNFAEGWSYIIGTSLKNYLEKENTSIASGTQA